MFKNKIDYIQKTFARETPACRDIRLATTDANDQISIHPEEGRLLQLLIRLGNIKTIVEIGTLSGYSASWMADALPADGMIHTIEKDPTRAAHARQNLGNNPKITLHEGAALDILPTLTGPFDMVFIDADKISYDTYLDWAEANIRKGGLIVGDNSLLFDAVWTEDLPHRVRPTARTAMRNFNTRLGDPARYTSIMLPTDAGLTIAVKEF